MKGKKAVLMSDHTSVRNDIGYHNSASGFGSGVLGAGCWRALEYVEYRRSSDQFMHMQGLDQMHRLELHHATVPFF